MPELKNTFTGGKMNKDLDERLVPKGEYTDAMNIQVSTSEESAVGTVQNILGNSLGCPSNFTPDNGFTVGSISDESNDTLYWMVSGDPFNSSPVNYSNNTNLQAPVSISDQILRKTPTGCERVFVDKFGFSSINNSTDDSQELTGLSTEVLNMLQVGSEVTGIDSFGNTSNTTSVTWISSPNLYNVWFGSLPNSSTTTQNLYASNNINPMVKIGDEILIPAFYDGGSVPNTGTIWYGGGNQVYIKNYTGTLPDLVNESITLFYNDNAFSQTFQITNAVNANLVISGLGIPAVKVTLDANLPTSLDSILNPPDPSSFGNSSPDYVFSNYGANQNRIAAEITKTITVNNYVFDGNLYFWDLNSGNISYDVLNFNVNDIIEIASFNNQMGPITCKIQNIDPGNNAVYVTDPLTGQPITPFQVGGFINGVGNPDFSNVIIPVENSVWLNTNLNLSSGFDNSLSSYEVLLFTNNRVLNFNHGEAITGLNIIDDMLFWTDNRSEPKRININSSIEGTLPYPGVLTHTRLINPAQNQTFTSNIPIQEEHITVIRKPPLYAPVLEMVGERKGNSYGEFTYNFTGVNNNSQITLNISSPNSGPLNYEISDILLLQAFEIAPVFPITSADVRVVIVDIVSSISNSMEVVCDVLSIESSVNYATDIWGCDLDNGYNKLYKLKFPRFSFRYKYKDNEYSSFGPFSEPAFMAGTFDFQPNSGYNLGMENKLRELTIKQIVPGNLSEDIKQIDILYKESDSPNIYIVDEIKPSDQYWIDNSYKIKQETIKSLVASNQLLRTFDNVPRRALAQEISSNRIIYGNYEQNYDLNDTRVSFTFNLKNRNTGDYKSIKSLRNYQLGVVYTDEYNRQTPVLTDLSGSKAVGKADSSSNNQIEVRLNNDPPTWATYQKFFIKEVSTEYHNLALDRYFDAEDGNMWLSFSSNDRNKIDLDTTLFLKKAYNSSIPETTLEQYKVIDVKNEAPEYIRSRKVIIGSQSNEVFGDGSLPKDPTSPGGLGSTNSALFVGAHRDLTDGTNIFENGLPVVGQDVIYLSANLLENTLLDNLHKRHESPDHGSALSATHTTATETHPGGGGGKAINSPLFLRIRKQSIEFETTDETSWYEIDNIVRTTAGNKNAASARDGNRYIVKLKKELGEDASFTFSRSANGDTIHGNPSLLANIASGPDPSATAQQDTYYESGEGGGYSGYLVMDVAQEIVQNKSVFQGRFFVKILRDEYIDQVIVQPNIEDYRVVAKAEFGYIKDFAYEDPGSPIDQQTHQGGIDYINANGFDGTSGGNNVCLYTSTAAAYNAGSSYTYGATAANIASLQGLILPSHNAAPETPYDNNVYWGHHVWRKINEKQNDLNTKSRWVIDEAFAAGQEPLWGRHNYKTANEMAYPGDPNSYPPHPYANVIGQVSMGSTNYGGYNYLSSNPSSISHNRETLWGNDVNSNGSYYNGGYGQGLGKGFDTSTYEYNTTGLGISDYTIDLSYISTGKDYKEAYALLGASGTTGDSIASFHESDLSEYDLTAFGLDNPGPTQMNVAQQTVPNYKGRIFTWVYANYGIKSQHNRLAGDTQYVQDGGRGFWRDLWNIKGRNNSTVETKAKIFADNLAPGKFLRFREDPNKVVYEIVQVQKFYKTNYAENLHDKNEYPFFDLSWVGANGTQADAYWGAKRFAEVWHNYAHFNRRITFRLTLRAPDGGVIGTDGSGNPGGYDPLVPDGTNPIQIAHDTYNCPIEIVQKTFVLNDNEVEFPEDPAVFETEPKDGPDLNIFHEASDTLSINFVGKSGYAFAPTGSIVTTTSSGGNPNPIVPLPSGLPARVVSWTDNIVKLNTEVVQDFLTISNVITFSRPDGSYTTATFGGLIDSTVRAYTDPATGIVNPVTVSHSFRLSLNKRNVVYGLGWHNCYSFGNGVESDSIRDTFNSAFLDNGPKVSTTFEEGYETEQRKYGLIYSGIYNSNSGVNNLNQFIQAEKITKDLNPSYGSIQKLHAGWGQSGDLLALCEDRVLKVLANKDALFNADGSTNLTSSKNVLGTATPYSSEFGISKNPESFASESFRAYFTDKVRGKVMRLSRDGLTPISSAGMSDWFRDNLKKSRTLKGSYDDKKGEYNITLKGDEIAKTLSFKEDIKGWVSFKSFVPENAISCANEYYTFLDSKLWKHHDENVNRNTFYGSFNSSSVSVTLNNAPHIVKSFNTLNYEGSNSKINFNAGDKEYINLTPRKGWYVDDIYTDLEKGSIHDFINKEGKWFSYLKGKDITLQNGVNIVMNDDNSSLFDQSSFAIQGLGLLNSFASPQAVFGCTDTTANNYAPLATVDDGSCIMGTLGCTDSSAHANYNASAQVEDGSCEWYGCTNSSAINYVVGGLGPTADSYELLYPGSIIDNGSCILANYGCTDPLAINYNSNANIEDGSCISAIYGCVGRAVPTGGIIYATLASNYQGPGSGLGVEANTDDGSCTFTFCDDPSDPNYDADKINQVGFNRDFTTGAFTTTYTFIDVNQQLNPDFCAGSAFYACLDPTAQNYNSLVPPGITATACDGGVDGCMNTAGNMCTGPGTGLGQCCTPTQQFPNSCLDPNAPNYSGSPHGDCAGNIPISGTQSHPNYGDTSCCQQYGCVNDPAAANYVGGNIFGVGTLSVGSPTHVQGTGGCSGTGCCYDVPAYQCDASGLVVQTLLTGLDSPDIEANPQAYPGNSINNAFHPNLQTQGYWVDNATATDLAVTNEWEGTETGDGCIAGCMLSLYCEYENTATFDPIPNNGSCITFSGNQTPQYACIGGGCVQVGVCHPDYNNLTLHSTLPACQATCTTTIVTLSGAVDGCMDSSASNYNPAATFDSLATSMNTGGSCKFVVWHVPVGETVYGCQSIGLLDYNGGGISIVANANTIYTPTIVIGDINEAMSNCCVANNNLKYELVGGTTVGPTAC